jgi:hypothetical protein
MANADNAIGFVPIKHKTGGEIRLTEYKIKSGYNTALGKGDPLMGTGDGYVEEAAATEEEIIGVFAGCRYIDANGNPVYSEYWPANTATKGAADAAALVWDDPMIVFRIQCDTLALTDVGALADYDTGAPSATTRLSGVELVASSTATPASVRILGLSDIPDNAVGAYAKADVMFAEHVGLNSAAGAAGV